MSSHCKGEGMNDKKNKVSKEMEMETSPLLV